MKKRFNTEVSREIRQWIILGLNVVSMGIGIDFWCNGGAYTYNIVKKLNKKFNKNDTQENKESE